MRCMYKMYYCEVSVEFKVIVRGKLLCDVFSYGLF